MWKREVKVHSTIEAGGIGELKKEGEHTHITNIKLRIHVFYITTILDGVPGVLAKTVTLDEQELDALLEYNFKSGEVNRAFDRLSDGERLRTMDRCCPWCGALKINCGCSRK